MRCIQLLGVWGKPPAAGGKSTSPQAVFRAPPRALKGHPPCSSWILEEPKLSRLRGVEDAASARRGGARAGRAPVRRSRCRGRAGGGAASRPPGAHGAGGGRRFLDRRSWDGLEPRRADQCGGRKQGVVVRGRQQAIAGRRRVGRPRRALRLGRLRRVLGGRGHVRPEWPCEGRPLHRVGPALAVEKDADGAWGVQAETALTTGGDGGTIIH